MLLSSEDVASWQLIDVREEYEYRIARLPGFKLLPLSTWPQGSEDLDPAAPTAVLCLAGVRSARVAQALLAAGFVDVFNIEGGIRRALAGRPTGGASSSSAPAVA